MLSSAHGNGVFNSRLNYRNTLENSFDFLPSLFISKVCPQLSDGNVQTRFAGRCSQPTAGASDWLSQLPCADFRPTHSRAERHV